ncbi:type III restriction-modification system endonuclease [Limosilactobacillus reuteri]|uniref:Type III restriction endonuclease subunit R n=1 Tax=Limosilactobacillus reuteri TaxID=1598 RepID=A0A256VNG7_LIMRT|nr:type III restriction-modification system endonuclease [Limosilactobacillus reuteri]OYS60752.1 type III restriction endonuclease subunit R [Limosilactobacillus reuteri]OYS62262.1 type III restriction endonuclease subunit R [Limosilactobacillus reuteri]OYS65732.1 type III restriction endonuclease subunit R [Limosilactobacillus reuteri]OYS70905.1 type III restriction endonuclease subunit R [Limosilactobacillus reuteri]OYS76627.1 type III restriction endonuclease subunit R [Limosilactobacillus 
MKIKLETLQHQIDALAAIDKAFSGMDIMSNDPNANYIYANPLIRYRYNDKANIDIKMETGTGKTYVYTRMMYELHQKYGLFKFVIAVPSPSIKEGTRSFITSDYAKQHFSEFYENTRVQLNVINAGDFSARSGRRNFPAQLSEFVEATRQNANQIEVLLINQGMLHSKSMHRNDYDQTLLGGETAPIKAIAATRPVIIIDEPQRFPRGKKFYEDIEAMKPQLIVRFGATFPETTTGRGKNKVTKIDYYRGEPQFNLDAVDSFNQGLVKGIDIDYPDMTEEQANNLYKVKQAKAKELILSKGKKEYSLSVGENLADVDPGFEGNITYAGGTDRELSNGLTLSKDMKLIPGTFAQNYQDEIILQALDCHFKAERENFLRLNSGDNAPKIKTLSLFFIDSISSFRGENDGKGWLAQHFEDILTKKLKKLIDHYEMAIDDREKEYCAFLQATLKSLQSEHQDVYAGYFSEDRGSSDADIQAEVEDILSNKEKLLSFKDKDGNWLIRRFLFSKWTLREGWDNPNVFTIAKLRTSGSEISKIQEVGRGLRLPVDETGHRLNQDEWQSRLSFLIGYDERDFAQKLVGEINDDSPIQLNQEELTADMIKLIVKVKQQTDSKFDEDQLLDDLDEHNVITRSNKFKQDVEIDGQIMSGYDALCQLYPELEQQTKVAKDKVRDKNSKDSTTIKLRKQNWQQLKNLWLQLAKRQMIKFDPSVNKDAETVARNVFNDSDNKVFVLQCPQMVHQEVDTTSGNAVINETQADYSTEYLTMNYGKFLKILAKQTDLSVNLLNNLMIKAIKRLKNNTNYINERTLSNLIRIFNNQFNERIKTSYSYEPLDFSSSTSIYNAKKHEFVDTVPASVLGVYQSNATSDEKYLYDRPPLRYDSADPELRILNRSYGPKISVFGKLPKRAIKIPRFDNGTTTPDFIFKIEHGNRPIYLVIETKAENMRLGDEEIHIIQQKYFDHLKESGVYYRMATSEQEVHDLINKLENGELN